MKRWAARGLLGTVFLLAGLSKVGQEPARLAYLIGDYRLFPPLLAGLLAVVLPWVELVVGVALLGGRLVRGAALLASLLSLGFVTVVSWALLRGLRIDCGCLGPAQSLVSRSHLLADLALLGLALWVWLGPAEKSLPPTS